MVVLHSAILLKRYKRFLADIRLPDGREITIHCPNTGSMKNCVVPNSVCWYSVSESKTRKYPETLEIVTTLSGDLAGINTARTNELVAIGLQNNVITELMGYQIHRREVVYGNEKSRIDFVLADHPQDSRRCYLEVKNATLMEEKGQGLFPDAVSERGTKHLRELMHMVQQGHRAVLLFCVQHTGIKTVGPADAIDPLYGKTLRDAINAGVEVFAYGVGLEPSLDVMVLQNRLGVRT